MEITDCTMVNHHEKSLPIGSMGRFWYIYLHLVNFYGKLVGKYTIHGSYGLFGNIFLTCSKHRRVANPSISCCLLFLTRDRCGMMRNVLSNRTPHINQQLDTNPPNNALVENACHFPLGSMGLVYLPVVHLVDS